ncbi:MAG TPA: DnaB-like helicase C-terminal domain-containing protein [Longimicrobium sp.]|jgi:replicative DNA helicase
MDVIAIEEGAANWRDFRARTAASGAGLAVIDEVPSRRAFTLESVLDGSFLPDSAVTLLAGPSAHGKSGLALQIARNVATRRLGAVAYFTRESERGRIVERLLTTEARVDGHSIATVGMDAVKGVRERLAAAAATLEDLALHVLSDIGTMEHVSAECRAIVRHNSGLSLIVLDYISLFSASGRFTQDSDPLELTKATVALAREFGVPVLVIAPLEARSLVGENPRPKLSELGSWGVLADASTSVVLIHRPNVHERYGSAQDDIGPIQIQVEKHPRGETRMTGTIIPRIRLILPETFSTKCDYGVDILPSADQTV